MGRTYHLAQANMACLDQGIELLKQVSDALYTRTRPPMFTSGVGAHVRHNLDHLVSFVRGWREGRIDYDAREREPHIETVRQEAIERMQWIAGHLGQIEEDDAERPVLVKMDEGGLEDGARNWSRSTVKRELQFLLSHTIHHYALIAVRLRLEGLEPVEGFGVAPSTLRYQQNNLPCAP